MDTKELGQRLVDLCREGKNLEAVNTLYSPDIVSVEARGDETMPAEMRGIDAIRGKNQWWIENNEVHGSTVEGPMVNGDRFTVLFDYDVTFKPSGERMKLREVALYTTEGDKIVREDFFY